MRYPVLLIFSLLNACNAVMYIDPVPGNSGQSLAPGQTASFRFFTTDPSNHSGVNLAAGGSYQLEFPIVSNWIDGYIESDESGAAIGPTGFSDNQMPLDSLSLLKRSRQHRPLICRQRFQADRRATSAPGHCVCKSALTHRCQTSEAAWRECRTD